MIKSHEYEDQRRSVEQDQRTDDDLDPDLASRLGGSSSGSSELSPWLLTSLAGTFRKPSRVRIQPASGFSLFNGRKEYRDTWCGWRSFWRDMWIYLQGNPIITTEHYNTELFFQNFFRDFRSLTSTSVDLLAGNMKETIIKCPTKNRSTLSGFIVYYSLTTNSNYK